MTSPTDVFAFHSQFDRHPDDRIRLFRAITSVVPSDTEVLYAGSYIDIAPSVWFDDVTYLDIDKRASRFFACESEVAALVDVKRRSLGLDPRARAIRFLHQDFTEPLPLGERSIGLLVSLYAGFVSAHCTDALRVGGTLLVNPSHGDAAMASIDPRYELTAVVASRSGEYTITTDELDSYLVPKRSQEITAEALRKSGRGIGYTRSPFAYLFTRIR